MYTSTTNPLRGNRAKHNQTVDLKPGLGAGFKGVHRGSGGETPEVEREGSFDHTVGNVNRLSPSYLNRTINRSKKTRLSLVN